ncbi:MAG TPA: aldo/keto reductase [Trebonia sp.]|jgi:aryl-alcohol dehydrogenase-like predicted oxidoreductase|nr:aldo/keto reductase [Trebonia sp.]
MRYLNTDTAKRISKIGLGTWQFGSKEWGYGAEYSERSAHAIVRRAVALGVTLFDTAEIYAGGRSERILGRALGEDREAVFLAGKIFPIAPTGPLVKQRARASAGRLRASRLDLYQVHCPNPLSDDRAIMGDMRILQDTGLVGEVGVSDYSVERWRSAEVALGNRILSNQVEYSLLARGPETTLLPFAQQHGRVIIAFSPLAHGLLSGRYHEANLPSDRVRATSPHFRPERLARTARLLRVLREVADAHSATPAQAALAWTVRHPAVAAIPGASSLEQLESNVAAAEIVLSDDEDQALRDASSWSCAPAPLPSPVRRNVDMFRHTLRGGPYLARTIWQDVRSSFGRFAW